jgi:16S rRNA (cytosine967-C5)-methyltransferase
VQDASSQLVAPFLQVKPGQFVVDACAGAGGKSLHLAALMENKGQLLALDIYDYKLKQLKLRARRNGVHNLEPRLIQNTKVIKRLHNRADRVLIDAPCTGLGVLRRNPDAKWKLNPEFLQRVTATQSQLLEEYARMVKPGGKMVYATCSILPQENEEQLRKFLQKECGSEWVLEEEKHCSPADSGFDGFYMARLSRK